MVGTNFNHFLLSRDPSYSQSSRELLLFACWSDSFTNPAFELSSHQGTPVFRVESFAKQNSNFIQGTLSSGRASTEVRFPCDHNFRLGHFIMKDPLFEGEYDGLVPSWPIHWPHQYRPPFHKRSLMLGSFDESLISLRKFVLQTPPLQGREE